MSLTNFEKRFILSVTLLSLILNLSFILEIYNWDALNHIFKNNSQMKFYENSARGIIKGDFLIENYDNPYYGWMTVVGDESEWEQFPTHKSFYNHPLYAYLASLLILLFGGKLAGIYLIQAILNSLIPLFLFLMVKKISEVKSPAHFLASLFYTFYGVGIFYTGIVIPNTIVKLLIVILITILLKSDNIKKRYYLLSGFITGVLFTLSPLGYFLLAAIFIYIIVRSWKCKKLWVLKSSIFLLGFLCVMIFPVLRNIHVGSPILTLSSSLPFKFAAGNLNGSSGIGFEPPNEFVGVVRESGNEFFPIVKKTVKSYFESPFSCFLLFANKILAFLNNREFTENENIYYFENFSFVLKIARLTFGLLIPFSLIGFIFDFRKKNILLILVAIALFLNIIFLYYESGPRDLFSPLLIIFASFGVGRIKESCSGKNFKELIFISIIICLGFILSFFPGLFHVDEKTPFEFFIGLARESAREEHDMSKVVKAYKKAISIEPDNYIGYYFFGEYYYQNNQYEKAAEGFENVIRIKSDVKYSHGFLGISYLKIYFKDPLNRKTYLDKACDALNREISFFPGQNEIMEIYEKYCMGKPDNHPKNHIEDNFYW